jgi:sulfotransferase
MKTYHFLAGLPRSGNTLLSSLLNQNPDIYCSALSPLNSLMYSMHELLKSEHSLRNPNNIPKTINQIILNYYSDIKQNIIIDREKAWATQANFDLIKEYITPQPKIIFTVRPILEILTSWINILPEYSFVDKEMQDTNFWYKDYLTKNDNRCDFIMRPWGQIDKTIFSINQIIKPENKNVFCLIKYDDIVNTPQETMNKIYDFLEIPSYKHNFNKIKKLEKDNDEALGQPANLHEIRPKLSKVSKKPEDVLSDYVLNKYSNIGWGAL